MRVAVRRGVRRQLGADHAAGAGAVVDDHLLAELVAHLLRDDAADHVVAAAGRERNDQPDRPVGIIRLRRGRGGERDQKSGGGQQQRRILGIVLSIPNRISTPNGVTRALMPPFLTTCSHLFISLTMNAPNSAGDFFTTRRAFAGELLLHLGRILRGGQRRVQLVDDRLRRAGGRDDAPPVDGLVGRHAGFGDRRHVRQHLAVDSLLPTPMRAELAGLDVPAWSARATRTSPWCGRRPRRSSPARRP